MPYRILCNGTKQKSSETRSGLALMSSRFTPLHKIRYGIIFSKLAYKECEMNINEIVKTVLALIGALGGAAVIVGSLAAWLGKVWADKLFLKESAKYQKEIEDFKNQSTTELEHLRADITEKRDL